LLGASYFFYGWWDWRFLGLLALSTVIDFLLGRAIDRIEAGSAGALRRRRLLIVLSVVTNLSILGFFKYFNFFADSATAVLRAIGFEPDWVTLEIILPVGVSFYTFQSLSYTIDVYRGRLKASRSFTDFALFVSFFPQLVAGPIERAASLLPQIANRRVITAERIWSGAFFILWGYFEKVVVADNVGKIADDVFNNYERYQGVDILIGVFAFALQIFGDFSGYSNIARGLARIMGFDLMVNFRLPYFATSPADFWHRWHISLSSWLRDYLYVSLGGNRRGNVMTYRNLMLTMLLGGLWHGAAWNFVLWGAYHGIGLAAHRAFVQWRGGDSGSRSGMVRQWSRIGLMFTFTLGGWLLFRATSAEQVLGMVSSLGLQTSDSSLSTLARILFYCWPSVVMQFMQRRTGDMLFLLHLPAPVIVFIFAGILALLAILGAREPLEFIYFQF
jgi:D-alanyl-lipoteichoic acid acyltransferase DltB (MBOAT superfamily)